MHIFLRIVLSLLILGCPCAAQAAKHEGLKDRAGSLCKAFVNHPEDFKEIEPNQKCDVQDKYAGRLKNKNCFLHSVEGSTSPTKFVADFGGSGTCHPPAVAPISPDDDKTIVYLMAENPNVNGYGWGRSDRALDYKGTLLLTNDYNSDLRLVTPNSVVILCGVVNKLQGWISMAPSNPPVCEKFRKGAYDILSQKRGRERGDLAKADAMYGEKLPPDTHVIEFGEASFTGNDEKVEMLTLEYGTGAGCGCGWETLAIAHDSSPETRPYASALARLMEGMPQKCGVDENFSVIKIDGKAFVATNVRELPRLKEPSPHISERPFADRVLYGFQDGRFAEICRLKPQTVRVIDSDVLPVNELAYEPLE